MIQERLTRYLILLILVVVYCHVAACTTPREITISDQPGYAPDIKATAIAPDVQPVVPTPHSQMYQQSLPTAAPEATTVSDKKFVGSKNSTKYHLPSCEWALKIALSNQIWFSSAEEAQAKGYSACKVCKPP